MQKDLKTYLAAFITENKKARIEEVLSKRTRYVTLVLEDIFKAHNASAVLRTVDCFGLQDIHIIENYNNYKVNPYVTRGASQWIDLIKHNKKGENNTALCYQSLKDQGYKIYATTPNSEGILPEDILLDHKIAIALGNEHEGLSDYALKHADGLVRLPMYGFTESFNISVTAAICLYDLIRRLFNSEIHWQLSEWEKEELRLKWYMKIVKRSDLHEKEFNKQQAR